MTALKRCESLLISAEYIALEPEQLVGDALIVDLVRARRQRILDRRDPLVVDDRCALHELLELAHEQARLRDADGVAGRRRVVGCGGSALPLAARRLGGFRPPRPGGIRGSKPLAVDLL